MKARLVLIALLVAVLGGVEACSESLCKSNQDCPATQVCISGACLMGGSELECERDEECAIDEVCARDNICRKIGEEPDAGTGQPDAGDIPDVTVIPDSGMPPQVCQTDTQCGTPPMRICFSGQCTTGCGQPGGLTCGAGFICEPPTGKCIPGCRTDPECGPPSMICETSQCVAGCTVNASLCNPALQLCEPSTGRCVAIPTPCSGDGECNPPATVCEGMQCVSGCQAGGIQCSGATPMCNAATGRCVTGAGNGMFGATCADHMDCMSGLCLSRMIEGLATGICSIACSASSDCPADASCFNADGMGFCVAETLFNPPRAFDIAAGGMCIASNDMCKGRACDSTSTTCTKDCSRRADCAGFGDNCYVFSEPDGMGGTLYRDLCGMQAGLPVGQTCAQNTNCQTQICSRYTNLCVESCCSDADCAPADSCGLYDFDSTEGELRKICLAKAGAGLATLGTTCADNSECESELCVAQDPVTGGPKKCSTYCCTAADCSALPGGGRCLPFPGPTLLGMPTVVGTCAPL